MMTNGTRRADGRPKDIFILVGYDSAPKESLTNLLNRLMSDNVSVAFTTCEDVFLFPYLYKDFEVYFVHKNKFISYRTLVSVSEYTLDNGIPSGDLLARHTKDTSPIHRMFIREQVSELCYDHFYRTVYYVETVEGNENTVTYGDMGAVDEISKAEYDSLVKSCDGKKYGSYKIHAITLTDRLICSNKCY